MWGGGAPQLGLRRAKRDFVHGVPCSGGEELRTPTQSKEAKKRPLGDFAERSPGRGGFARPPAPRLSLSSYHFHLTFFHLMEPPDPISTSTRETSNCYTYYFSGSRSKVKFINQEGERLCRTPWTKFRLAGPESTGQRGKRDFENVVRGRAKPPSPLLTRPPPAG